jgi:hypothetical protein
MAESDHLMHQLPRRRPVQVVRPVQVTGQACPECGPVGQSPFCPWCYGTNVVSDAQWGQWVIAQGGREG